MMKRRSALFGLVIACLDCAWLTLANYQAHDFTWPWEAARMLWAGQSPYTGFHLAGGAAFADPFFYPLPAALIALPFASLPVELAGAIWSGLGAGLLCYAVTTRAPHLWPLLLSAPALIAFRNAQWSPLIIALSLLSPYAFGIAVAKPTLMLALWMQKPSWEPVALAAVLVGVSFAVQPGWLSEWLPLAGNTPHEIPVLVLPFGPLLLLAALRWRDPRARLLLVLACVPQMLYFYDQLPLFLVCSRKKHALLLCALSWLAYLVGPLTIVPLVYLPALMMLFHPIQAEERASQKVTAP